MASLQCTASELFLDSELERAGIWESLGMFLHTGRPRTSNPNRVVPILEAMGGGDRGPKKLDKLGRPLNFGNYVNGYLVEQKPGGGKGKGKGAGKQGGGKGGGKTKGGGKGGGKDNGKGGDGGGGGAPSTNFSFGDFVPGGVTTNRFSSASSMISKNRSPSSSMMSKNRSSSPSMTPTFLSSAPRTSNSQKSSVGVGHKPWCNGLCRGQCGGPEHQAWCNGSCGGECMGMQGQSSGGGRGRGGGGKGGGKDGGKGGGRDGGKGRDGGGKGKDGGKGKLAQGKAPRAEEAGIERTLTLNLTLTLTLI